MNQAGAPGTDRLPFDPGRRKVVYFRISDPSYPRNRLIRSALGRDLRFRVITLTRDRRGGHLAAIAREYRRLWREADRNSIIVLSEFANSHALPTRLIAWLKRSSLIVDGFIGLYETAVEDKKKYGTRTWRAFRLRLLDAIAFRVADIYIVDNDYRASLLRARFGERTEILAVPVAAPEWAIWAESRTNRQEPLRILYYGNYIPLHGVPTVLDAVARLDIPWTLRMIGDGDGRLAAERMVSELCMQDRVEFLAPVAEADLAGHIHDSDVVMGVFGTSPKARSVVANKVWQGLACGRTVITQANDATDQLKKIAGEILVTPDSNAPGDVAQALRSVALSPRRADPDVTRRLSDWVSERLRHLLNRIYTLT